MAVGEQITHILRSYVLKSFTIGFAVLLVILVVWLVHGYREGTYWNAKRAKSDGNIERAIMLFKESVYEDNKVSRKALLALEEMDDVMALEALIDLLDIPEMNKMDHKIRAQMCDVIRQRTSGTTADKLPLDPKASQEIRTEQKRQWQEWFSKAKEQYDWKDGTFVPRRPPTPVPPENPVGGPATREAGEK